MRRAGWLGALAGMVCLVATPVGAAMGQQVLVGADAAADHRAPSQLIQDFKSPSIAVNPANSDDLVVAYRNDTPDFGCQPAYSSDGGRTWAASTFPAPRRGTCWSPAVAFSEANTVYLAAQDRNAAPPRCTDISVWSSTDGGRTFGAPTLIPQSAVGSCPFSVQAGIVVDRTRTKHPQGPRIYVTWYAFPNFASIRLFLTHSDDGGGSWSNPVSDPVAAENQFFPTPAVGPDGTVYIVYKDAPNHTCGNLDFGPFGPETCPIRVVRSDDGGAIFASATASRAGFKVASAAYDDVTAQEAPGIAVAPNGDVLVTYSSLADLPTPAGCQRSLQAYVARSTDRGVTWSRQRVNDDPCAGGARHRDPWVSVAPNGRVDAVFYDDRNDPDHVLADAYYASSTNGGATFGANRRVSDRSFDLSAQISPNQPNFKSNEFDQTNGAVSTDGAAVVAWGDTRNTLANSPSGDPQTTAADVETARVAAPSAGVSRPETRIVGADPYAIAVAMSAATFSYAGLTDPADGNSDRFVVVASGESLQEALAGSTLARKLRAPLLLSPAAGLPATVLAEIKRVNPTKAYILGGSDMLSTSIDAALTGSGITPVRVSGTHPYGNAQQIAQLLGMPASRTAVVVAGDDLSEGLTAGAFAAFERLPLLFVSRDTVPVETEQAFNSLGITKTIVVGSTATVSAAVIDQLNSAGRNPVRVAGGDAHAVAASLASLAMASAPVIPVPVNVVYAASTLVPGDAVAAGAAIAYRGGVLTLADTDAPSSAFLQNSASSVDQVVLIGNCAGLLPLTGFTAATAGAGCRPAGAVQAATAATITTPDTGAGLTPLGAASGAVGAAALTLAFLIPDGRRRRRRSATTSLGG